MLYYLNTAFSGVGMKSVDVTLTPVQATLGLLTRSIVFRHTLSVTITYVPRWGEDGSITIISISLGDILFTQLRSDDFVSDLQEDEARIVALFIDDNAVPSPNTAPTPSPNLFPTRFPTTRPLASTTIKPTALPTAVPMKFPTPQPTLKPTPLTTPKHNPSPFFAPTIKPTPAQPLSQLYLQP